MVASEAVVAVILFVVGAICKKTQKEFRDYKQITAEKSDAQLRVKIQDEIQPIMEGIQRLHKRIDAIEDKESDDIKIILESYKYRYVSLCKRFIEQGYLTPDQHEQILEMYRVYTSLGGNGQAAEYHARIVLLPICKDPKDISNYN